jgi:hypothetical protein
MTMCAATRLLVPAFLVGLGVSSVAGNDLYGWVAGALTVGGLAIVQRRRGTAATCALAPPRVELGTKVEQGVDDVRRSPSR